jgi:hypothetical protein
LTFNGLHGVISQKIVIFINIAVRTSNPTNKEFVLRGVIKTPREATGVKNC